MNRANGLEKYFKWSKNILTKSARAQFWTHVWYCGIMIQRMRLNHTHWRRNNSLVHQKNVSRAKRLLIYLLCILQNQTTLCLMIVSLHLYIIGGMLKQKTSIQSIYWHIRARAGVENIGISNSDCNNPINANACVNVTMYSLVTYLNKFIPNKNIPINYLSIHLEGWDYNVLLGGKKYICNKIAESI